MVRTKQSLFAACVSLALSLTLSCSSENEGGGYTGSYGSVQHGGQTYKTVQIGTQIWMAENLNYNANGSKCYNNDPANCNKYGRLYNWATALTVCPSGWRLPSNADWDKLFKYVDAQNGGEGDGTPYESYTAGKYLKATGGWNINGNGTDEHGFSALPGGTGFSVGSFNYVGNFGNWWKFHDKL